MKKVAASAVLLLLAHGIAIAEDNYTSTSPGYYLVTIYNEEGEKTFETGLWRAKIYDEDAVLAPYVGFGYGVTKRWYTEVYAHGLHTEEGGTHVNDFAWQNDYVLTSSQSRLQVALHTNLTRYRNTDLGYAFEFGPAMQMEFGETQANVNVFFARSYRAEDDGRMQMKYQWQVKHHWNPKFAFGLQGFGELGDWDHWEPREEQSHRLGAVVSGALPVSDTHALNYEIAYFGGKIYAERAKALVIRLKYEF
jgi:hypothetical protein